MTRTPPAPRRRPEVWYRRGVIETYVRGRIERFLDPLGKVLASLRITPIALTLSGLAMCVCAAFLVGNGHAVAGGWVFLAGSALDGLDGTVARLTGTSSRRGALVDSVADRLGEISLWGGLAAFLVDQPTLVLVCVVSLGGALLTSYLRAKAEAVGADGRGGLVGRGERVIVLSAGLILGNLSWVLPGLAVVIWITVIQRFVVIWKRLGP